MSPERSASLRGNRLSTNNPLEKTMNRSMDVSDKVPTERLSTRADGTWELHKKVLPPRVIYKGMKYAVGRGCRTFHHGKVSFNAPSAVPALGNFIFSQEAAIGRRG